MKRIIYILLLFIPLLGFSTQKTPILSGAWTSTLTWGGAIPTSSDSVTITNTAITCTSTADVCKTLTTSSTTTLTVTGRVVTYGDVFLASGMAMSWTGTLTVNASASITSNGNVISTFVTAPIARTTTLLDTLNIVDFVQAASYTQTFNGYGINISGSFTSQYVLQGTSLLVFNGTGTLTHTGAGIIINSITFKTSGTITLGSLLSIGTGTYTFVSGTIVTTGNTLKAKTGATLNLAGINFNIFSTATTTTNPNYTLTSLFTAKKIDINSASSPTFSGTSGFTIDSLVGLTAAKTLTLKESVTYTVNEYISVTGTSGSHATITSSHASTKTIFTLGSNCVEALAFCNGTRVDSSGGKLVNAPGGTLTSTINWGVLGGGSPIFID